MPTSGAPVREIDHDRSPIIRENDPRYATPDYRCDGGYHRLYGSPRLGSQRVAGESRMGGPHASTYRKINNSSRTNRSRGR